MSYRGIDEGSAPTQESQKHKSANDTMNTLNYKLRHVNAMTSIPNTTDHVRFMFVREPYSRLLSAFVDKLFCPNPYFWKSIGTYIMKNFRTNATEASMNCGHDVTFPEVVKYVIHAQQTGKHRDGHFIPTHDHCNLCLVKYHFHFIA